MKSHYAKWCALILCWVSGLGSTAGATADARVSHFHVDIGVWTFVPIVEEQGAVRTTIAFLATRNDGGAVGDNIMAILFERDASTSQWTDEAWTNTDAGDVVVHVKARYAITSDWDHAWLIEFGSTSVDAGVGEPYFNGLLAADPLQGVVQFLSDPTELLEVLVEMGHPAATAVPASIGGGEACPNPVVPAIAEGVDAAENDPLANPELIAYTALINSDCISACVPWTWTTAGPTLVGCTCTAWALSTTAIPNPSFVAGGQCAATCWHKSTSTCTYTRTSTKRKANCATCTWTQTATSIKTFEATSVTIHIDPCALPPGYVCPTTPDDPSCRTAPAPSGGWAPGAPC